jgi:hypothetical protein
MKLLFTSRDSPRLESLRGISVGTVESAELYFLNILSIVALYYSVIRAHNAVDVELDLRADYSTLITVFHVLKLCKSVAA